MSSEEQDAAFGRAVKDYGEERKKLAALLSQASEYARALREVADYLSPGAEHPHHPSLRGGMTLPDRTREAIAKLPTQEQVRNVVSEAIAARERKRELQQTLSAAGVDLKD